MSNSFSTFVILIVQIPGFLADLVPGSGSAEKPSANALILSLDHMECCKARFVPSVEYNHLDFDRTLATNDKILRLGE